MARLVSPDERNKTQKAAHQSAALELRKQGFTIDQIAEALNLSHGTVWNDLDKLNRAAIARVVDDKAKAIREVLAVTMESIHESQMAWKASLKPVKRGIIKDGETLWTDVDEMTGNPGHQRNILKGIEIISKLLKLYDENKSDDGKLTAMESELDKNLRESEKKLKAHKEQFKMLKSAAVQPDVTQ